MLTIKDYNKKIKKFTRFAIISLIMVFVISYTVSMIEFASAKTDPYNDEAYQYIYLLSRSEEFKNRHNNLCNNPINDDKHGSYASFCRDHYDTNDGKDCWWINSDGYWGWGAPYIFWIAPFKNNDGTFWVKNGFTVKKPSKEDGTLKKIVGESKYNSTSVGGVLVTAADINRNFSELEFVRVWAKGMCEGGDGAVTLAWFASGGSVADIASVVFSLKNIKSNESTYSTDDGGIVTIMHSGYYGSTIFWESLALKNAYNVTKAAGITLMVLYFIMGLLSEAQISEVTAEMLIKKLLGFAIAVLIISHGFEIISAILEFGESMMSAIHEATSSTIVQSTSFREVLQEIYDHRANQGGWFASTFDMLGFYFWLAIQYVRYMGFALVGLFCIIAIYAMGFGRIFELYARVIFAPIGLAPMVDGGVHSSGIRYLKKIGSLAIQGAVVMACLSGIQLVQVFIESTSTQGVWFFPRIVSSITAIGIVKNSSRISDDIMGV